MPKYLMKFKSIGTSVQVGYNSDGWLVSMEVEGNMDQKQFEFFFGNLPVRESWVKKFQKIMTPNKLSVEQMEEDLTFDRFWNDYGHKVGHKARAKKLWEALSKEDRHSALKYIQIYNQTLIKNPGQSKLYPETYLSQTRWNV